jgi:WS/DGAT/MGAT family acyltransferase
MGGLDAAFLAAETPAMHLHVVGVLLLDAKSAPKGWRPERVMELMAQRLPLLPPFRWQMVGRPDGIDRPRWIEAPNFSLADHVHRATLAAPGGSAELEAFIGQVASVPLDRSRPLWDLHVVDGLADGSVAVVTKLHHAFMDGGAGSAVMASLFDLDPEQTSPAPEDTWEPEAPPTALESVAQTASGMMRRATRAPSTVTRSMRSASAFMGAMFPARRGGRGPFAPRTPFNGPLTPRRTVALGGTSLSTARAIRSAYGCTVNDVVLAAVAGALRSLVIDGGGEPSHPLIASVPVSVRSEPTPGAFDNRTSVVMVPLPTDLDDPELRLLDVAERSRAAKDHHGALGPDLIEDWTQLLPPWAIAAGADLWSRRGLAALMPPVFNLVVSNVPGPPIPLYLAGCPVLATYPLGPLMEGSGLNVTVLSQCDDLLIGVTACPDLVPNPTALVDGFCDEVATLAASASHYNRAKVEASGEV